GGPVLVMATAPGSPRAEGLLRRSAKTAAVADAPDTIVLERHRDLDGRLNDIWAGRSLFALLCAVPVLALLNVFGQRPSTTTATAAGAVLDVYAAAHVRGGLLFEARFHVTARRDLTDAVLVLDSGWLEGMTVNTIEP